MRYTNSNAKQTPPRIVLTAQNGSDAELVGLTFHTQQVLARPGNAVVVRAQRDTAITIEVIPAEDDGSLDAEIHMERITSHLPQEKRVEPAALAPVQMEALQDFQILAHVARHGDVVVGSGEWICGPRVPMSIEGLEVRLGRLAAGLDILVSGEARLRRPLTFPAASAGSFVGTRGRAAPLTALTFSLIGRSAASYQLCVDALFLGAPIASKVGNSIELSGPTGTEPLVGIRLALQELQHAGARPLTARPVTTIAPRPSSEMMPEVAAPTKRVANGSTGRVRVFRASNAHSV